MKLEIRARLHLVAHSLCVETSKGKLHALALQSTPVVHQIVVQNALRIKTVLAR